jgi:hypothetical protein
MKPRVGPGEHRFGVLPLEEPAPHEQPEHGAAKRYGERGRVVRRPWHEGAIASETAVGRNHMNVRMPIGEGPVGLNAAHDPHYGVVSYATSLRRNEMATRLALGASPQSVFLIVVKRGVTLGLAGAGIGVTLAWFSGKIISSQVYAIRASDPVILLVATALITTITILASVIPAARAARLSPASALQSE